MSINSIEDQLFPASKDKPASNLVSLKRVIQVCGDLGAKAGDILREVHFARLKDGKDGLKLVDKGAAQGKAFDPQTIADRRSERLILAGLKEAFGEQLCVVGEESGLQGTNVGAREEEVEEGDDVVGDKSVLDADAKLAVSPPRVILDWWTKSDEELVEFSRVSVWIDPLDATREFTEGHVSFCSILIGIAVDCRSVAGIMVQPFGDTSCLFWGRVGVGCFKTTLCYDKSHGHHKEDNKNCSRSIPVWIRQPFDSSKDLRVTVSRSRQGGLVQNFTSRLVNYLATAKNMEVQFSFAGGCGFKILELLHGNADLYPFPCSGTSLWDSCAGDALVEAAGGLLTDKRGQRLVYDSTRRTYENSLGLLAARDFRMCDLAANTISTCLDYFRLSSSGEFITESHLSKYLGTKVVSVETPSLSLAISPKEHTVEMDVVATLAGGGERRLRLRRFDPLTLAGEASSPTMDTVFARKAAEVQVIERLAGILSRGKMRGAQGKLIHLDRTSARRAPTVNECLSEEGRDSRGGKMFLQAAGFAVIFEATEPHKETFELQVAYLRDFHDLTSRDQSMLEGLYNSSWRFKDIFEQDLTEKDSSGTLHDESPKKMRMSPLPPVQAKSMTNATLAIAAANTVRQEEEEQQHEDADVSSGISSVAGRASFTHASKAKPDFTIEVARLEKLSRAYLDASSSSKTLTRDSIAHDESMYREEFMARNGALNDPDVKPSPSSLKLPETTSSDDIEVQQMVAMAKKNAVFDVPFQEPAIDEAEESHEGFPEPEFVALRGLWGEMVSSMDDLHLISVAKVLSNDEGNRLRLLDVVHLMLMKGVSIINLETIHRVYFSQDVRESQVVLQIKYAMVDYLRRIVRSPSFHETFARSKQHASFKQRIRLVAKMLADELETTKKLDATNLDCFTISNISSPSAARL